MAVHQLWRFPRAGKGEEEGEESMEEMVRSLAGGLGNFRGAGITAEEIGSVIRRHHGHIWRVGEGQCSSVVGQRIRAAAGVVWGIVRRFDRPQGYKSFVKRCSMITSGDGLAVGSTRQVEIVSGLPAASSTERLEILDEDLHILSFRILGGQHRLRNYQSITTLHQFPPPEAAAAGSPPFASSQNLQSAPVTIVIESYVVDIPDGNTIDETRLFVDTIVKCNLHSLACISENRALPQRAANNEP